MGGGTTTLALSGLPDGQYAFRVRSEFPGALCTYIEQPGNTQAVRVDHRTAFTATGVSVQIVRADLANGVFEVDAVLVNESAETLLNPVSLEIVGIDASTGDVRVINADNAGGGTSAADAAAFSYAGPVLGEELTPGETSGRAPCASPTPATSSSTSRRASTATGSPRPHPRMRSA